MASPAVSALGVLVRDITNGIDLYDKDPDTVNANKSPASLVKLMTAVLLMEFKGSSLSDTATVEAGDIVSGTDAGLQDGDVISYEDLLYGLLLPSGNDAAETVARTLGSDGAGTDGRTGFVSAMNAKATTLGMTNTTFLSPNGFPEEDDRSTARDIAILAEEAWSNATIKAISGTASRLITITGANARTYTVDHSTDQAVGGNFSDDNVLAVKGGFHDLLGTTNDTWSLATLWEAPAGQEIIVVVLHSTAAGNRYMDHRAIVYEAVEDFPDLVEGVGVGVDANFSSVRTLAGFDGSIVDEGPVGRTLTAQGDAAVNTTDPLVNSGDLAVDGTGDYVTAADDDDLSMGSGEFTVECYFRGSGTEPANATFVAKWLTTGNQREWSLEWEASPNRVILYHSTTGSNFPVAYFDVDDFGITPAAFFNGGKRHILGRRDGNEFAVYVNGVKGNGPVTTTGSLFNGTALHTIGARSDGSQPFTGNIDEVRVSAVDRTAGADKFTPTGREFPRTGSLPTAPTLSGEAVGAQIDLTWTAATSDLGISHYNIYRDGILIDTSATTSYSDTTVTAGVEYDYVVTAVDNGLNEGGDSNEVTITANVLGPTPPIYLSSQLRWFQQ